MKTVVVFQGGGALGAFGCGAWCELAPWLRRRGDEVAGVAGASIGAINAAFVARRLHEADAGATALAAFWRDEIATPSFPFFGLPLGHSPQARRIAAWNGFLTGILLGNRALYLPWYPHWNPLAHLRQLHFPLMERSRMRRTLATHVGSYRSTAPRQPMLAVSATDMMSGQLRLFDSDMGDIGVEQLAASSAIPLLFDPVQLDGTTYWDGDLTRHSLLPLLLERLRASGRIGAAGEPYRLVSIEQFPAPLSGVPVSGPEQVYRVINLLELDKLTPALAPAPGVRHWLRLLRPPLPHDAVSGQFDYSPLRIGELVAQGRAAAREALAQVDAGEDGRSSRQPPLARVG